MNIVTLFIPIYNERHFIIRDTVTKMLNRDAEKVILSDRVLMKSYRDRKEPFPMCRMDVYVARLDLDDIEYFKAIALSISQHVEDVIVLKIQQEYKTILSARYGDMQEGEPLNIVEAVSKPIVIHRVSKQVLNLNYTKDTEGLGLIHLFFMGHFIKTIHIDLTSDMEMR